MLSGQRFSFNQLTIFGMIILVFCVQTLNCFAIQDYLQNNSNQDAKIEDGGVINFRSNHRISESLKEIAATLNIIASVMESDSSIQSRLNKRAGFDLGLSRGYSGAKQAKHLMELASAQTGYGPESSSENPLITHTN